MTLGAEPKKVAILGAIVVAGLVIYYINSTGDSAPAPAPRTAVSNPSNAAPLPVGSASPRTQARVANSEWRARVLGTRPEDRVDPASIDPELKLDLLAKVQAVPPIEGGRNLFQFGAAPAPDKPLPAVPTNVPKIAINQPTPKPVTNVLSSVPPGRRLRRRSVSNITGIRYRRQMAAKRLFCSMGTISSSRPRIRP